MDGADEQLAAAEARGFDTLLAEHRDTWALLWADAEVTIEGFRQLSWPQTLRCSTYASFKLGI